MLPREAKEGSRRQDSVFSSSDTCQGSLVCWAGEGWCRVQKQEKTAATETICSFRLWPRGPKLILGRRLLPSLTHCLC